MDPKDRRKLKALKDDGYLKRENPLTPKVLAALHEASAERPAWYDAFFEMAVDGKGSNFERQFTHPRREETAVMPLYQLLGRVDNGDGRNNPRVLACLVRRGLGARVKDIAAEVGMSEVYVREIRNTWEHEIRALLQDARCLGLTGADLYHAVSTPGYEPTRLLERIIDLRKARTDNEAPGVLPGQYEEELKAAWFDYRTKQGLKGRAPDMDVYPPRWFVAQLT